MQHKEIIYAFSEIKSGFYEIAFDQKPELIVFV